MSAPALKYMQAEELAEKIVDGSVASGQVVVMDVRAFLDKVVEQFAADESAGKRSLVVHCAMSQQRGPSCARALLNRFTELGRDPATLPEVLVLSGGFNQFGEKFDGDDNLIA